MLMSRPGRSLLQVLKAVITDLLRWAMQALLEQQKKELAVMQTSPYLGPVAHQVGAVICH